VCVFYFFHFVHLSCSLGALFLPKPSANHCHFSAPHASYLKKVSKLDTNSTRLDTVAPFWEQQKLAEVENFVQKLASRKAQENGNLGPSFGEIRKTNLRRRTSQGRRKSSRAERLACGGPALPARSNNRQQQIES